MIPPLSGPPRAGAPAPRRQRLRRVKAGGLLAAVALLVGIGLTACSSTPDELSPVPYETGESAATGSASPTGAPAGFEQYYNQDVQWEPCDGSYECATVTAPLDWADPTSEPIELALERHSATGSTRIGSLLVNPGGPGAMGTDFITYASQVFGESVVAAYDLVGFDPRGVGRSSAVECLDDADWDQFISASYPVTPEGLALATAQSDEFGQACAQHTGALLDNVDTVSTARDLDLLRAVLGDTLLSYFGYSYGTQLGSTYAALFPGNVGRMVLDGAIDPTVSPADLVLGQAEGFEQALRAFVADCQSGADCPLVGGVDAGAEQIGDLLDGLLGRPMPTNDPQRPLTQTLGVYGVVYPLYARYLWPNLADALAAALNNRDGSALLANADAYNSRNADGTFADNSGPAFYAISCQEPRESADPAVMAAEASRLEAAAPTVGRFMAYGAIVCANWPAPVVELTADVAAPGTGPIVVVGTTGDPATPYAWAQGLAATLDGGVLVTYEGEGHGAYGSSNSCIGDAVDDYLVAGTPPQDGLRC